MEQGVKAAYAVIDEYMQRGLDAAAALNPDWRGQMDRNRCNYSNPNMSYGPLWPIVAPWMQMMQAWTAAAGAFVPGACAPPSWNPYTARDAGGCADAAPATPAVSVKVKSDYPTEVEASLHAGTDAMRLTADALEADENGYQLPLKAVGIKCECGHVRVNLTIPTDQPSGRYSGAIRDSAGCQRGELSVEVWNPGAGKSAKR